jgi:hypothetical protein
MARTGEFVLVTRDEDFVTLSVLRGAPPKVIWLNVGNARNAAIESLLRTRANDIERFAAHIDVRDRNAWYLGLAERELAALAGEWQPLLLQRLGPERARHFVTNWQQLVLVLRRGELRPTHLRAQKPL